MQLRTLKRIATLPTRDRGLIRKFLKERKLRLAVIREFRNNGIGKDLDDDDIDGWLEIILKYLPMFIQIILLLI